MEQEQKKLGIIYSFPVCVIMIFLCFPIGFILLFTRFYKNGTVSKAIRNVVIAFNVVLLALLAIGIFSEPESNESTQLKDIDKQELETPVASFPDEIPDITETEEPPTVSEEVKSNDDATEKQNFLLPEPKPEEETPESNPTFSLPPGISYYELSLEVAREEIDKILETEPLDTDQLLEYYEFLLYYRVNEFVFKSMAYGHFTGDYETKKFDYITDEIHDIVSSMAEYIGEEEANFELQLNTVTAYRTFDESMVEYEVFAEYYPDIDAMWDSIYDEIYLYNTGAYGKNE